MKNIDILIIPYRDLYFWKKYGSAVRDLQFLEIITNMGAFETIYVANRPVSTYERITNKIRSAKSYPGVKVIDETSYDLIGPLFGRSWTRHCYKKLVSGIVSKYINSNKNLIILDFSPFLLMDNPNCNNIILWHDMIDNFTKHNRFSEYEKESVRKKYFNVSVNYDLVTAVSRAALDSLRNETEDRRSVVISNGVFESKFASMDSARFNSKQIYDFGFIGFVTDKFDVDFVLKLSEKYSVVIYGHVMDKKISKRLVKSGIDVMGGFKYSNLAAIMESFNVGLLPYLEEKSHDGSPLKLYEYLKSNKPCLTTITYEHQGPYVVNINDSSDLESDINRLFRVANTPSVSQSLPEAAYLENKLTPVVDALIQRFKCQTADCLELI